MKRHESTAFVFNCTPWPSAPTVEDRGDDPLLLLLVVVPVVPVASCAGLVAKENAAAKIAATKAVIHPGN